jgi:hypothetical protein
MPKPILNTGQQQNQTQQLRLNENTIVGTNVDPRLLERRLRQKRSNAYMEAVKQLDIGGETMNQAAFDAFVNAVKNEFPDVPFKDQLVGFVAKCYLGLPFEVHTLDISGGIIKHYRVSEGLPPLMEKARSIAIHGGYAFIEVYADSIRPVKEDGSVSVVSYNGGGGN